MGLLPCCFSPKNNLNGNFFKKKKFCLEYLALKLERFYQFDIKRFYEYVQGNQKQKINIINSAKDSVLLLIQFHIVLKKIWRIWLSFIKIVCLSFFQKLFKDDSLNTMGDHIMKRFSSISSFLRINTIYTVSNIKYITTVAKFNSVKYKHIMLISVFHFLSTYYQCFSYHIQIKCR